MGHEAELGGDNDLVAPGRDRVADDFLAVERAVDLDGVDVGDAEVECAVDGVDGLGVVQAAAGGVGAGQVMAPRPIRETFGPRVWRASTQNSLCVVVSR
jgi:hypothetical protein